MSFQLRVIEVRGVRYVRIEDVAEYIREIAATEETDTRNRLLTAAQHLEKTVT